MSRTLRRLLLPALAGLCLLLLLTVTAAVLVVYREAAALHPWAGSGVLVAAGLALFLLVARPILAVARLPRTLTPVAPDAGPAWERYVRKYAQRLRRSPVLRAEWEGWSALDAAVREREPAAALAPRVEAALAHLDDVARNRIRHRAAMVFAMTAVSQSGRLDTVVVLAAQLRLVREIAELYLQRPTTAELLRLYGQVGAAAFVAGEIQDSEILAVLGAPVGAAVTNLIPLQGTDPLVSLLVTSLMDGSANGFLTLRVGVIARRYCQLVPGKERRAVSASASLEAAGLLGGTVSDGASRVARAVRRLVVQGAVEGTGKAARGLAGAGRDAAGRMAGLLDKTAKDVGRRLSAPPRRVLEQALEFWEGVARQSGDDSSAGLAD